MPSNTVYYSIQDNNGYIWFGTDKGVSKYNGYTFENFNYKDGLGDNEVFDIFQDSKNRIWFSGYNGKLSFYSNGAFNNINNNDLLKKSDFKGIGIKVQEDSKGNLFYVTNQALYSSFFQKPIEISDQYALYASLTCNDQNDVVMLGALKDTFIINNLTKKRVTYFSNSNLEKKVMPRINSKSLMVQNSFYFNYANDIIEIDLLKNNYQIAYEFDNSEQVQCFQKSENNLIWVGTQSGLYLFDTKKKEITASYLKGASVSSINFDNEKNIWVTSLNKGVFLIINKNISFYNSKSGLDFDKCIYLNVIDSTIVVGSQNYKCAFISDKKITNLLLKQQPGEGKIESVKKDNHGNLFISTGGSIFELKNNLETKNIFKLAVSDVLITDSFTTIAQGYRVIQFRNNPIDIGNFLLMAQQPNIPSIKIKAKKIFQTRDSSIYILGSFGAQKIKNNTLEEIHSTSILKNNIVDFTETSDGVQWFASSVDGIVAIYNKNAYHITSKEGLPSDFVSSITIDNHENVWLGTQNGLCKITYDLSKKKGQIYRYNKTSGLVSNSINDVLFYNNNMWVATDYGVCTFNERDLMVKGYKPYLIIEAVVWGDDKILPKGNKYVISNKKKSLKIKFIGISMSSLSNIRYQYRLDGPNQPWIETHNTELEFPSLPPGTHTLEIKAINSQNETSEGTTITIEIIPSFYQTTWFYGIMMILIIIVLIVGIRLRIKTIHKKHQEKQYLLRLENEKLENEKKEVEFNISLSEIKQKALMLHMNPHFVFNSINAINGFYSSGDFHHAKIYVSMFSSLLRSILDFSQKKLITIKEEVELLEKYLKLNQIRFNGKFTFIIDVDAAIIQSNQLIPPMIIQPFVENAIIHGIAPMDGGGEIKIKIYQSTGYLHCVIEDNGIGLKKSAEINRNRIHNSTGIEVSKERIRFFSNVSDDSCFSISEKPLPQTGCIVHFKLNTENLW